MSEGAMTKDEFVQGMKTLREEAAEAVADPEGSEPEEGFSLALASVTLSGEEAAMLSLYIKDTICWALECDRYFNETMIFDLVHLADRLGGM